MMMQPSIVFRDNTKLVGMRVCMSLTHNQTQQLWSGFMPRRNEVLHTVDDLLYNVQIYPPQYFAAFGPAEPFEKWAAVAVADFGQLPLGMEAMELPGGMYALFRYKGPGGDPAVFQYIYTQWLPASGYLLDNRPHFEVLGTAYKKTDPGSEEDIWIPVKKNNEDPGL